MPLSTYQETVAGLLVDDGHVGPVEEFDELHHGLGLVLVGRDGAGEERVALDGAEGGTRREEAHLKTEQTQTRRQAHCYVHQIDIIMIIIIIIINTVLVYAIYLPIKPFRRALHFT